MVRQDNRAFQDAFAVAAVAQRAPSRSRPSPTGRHRGLVEARRYRLVARRMDKAALPTRLRVSRRAVDDLLAGRVRFLTPAQATRFEGLVSKKTRAWLRESTRHERIGGGELPVALLIPLVQYGIERYGREGAAALCEMTARSMLRILTDCTSVSFALADRLVAGLDGPGWWLETEERRAWYWGHNARLGSC